ncbi:MAG: sodium:solute symporter family protein [Candidatus Aminicenantes bacterium]|nr:sodium:solute symporter family protein [Candidatus Aminicenantes bacterium]
MRPEFFLVLAGYLAVLLAVGLKFSRKQKDLEGFFLASRSLSGSLVFLSLAASWFGATSILVTADEAYRAGVSALWLVGVPAAATVLFLAAFLAGPIRRLDVQTLPGLVEARYGKTVRHIASFLILWYMIVLASSQMVALGQFLKPFLGVSAAWSLGLGTAAVVIYLVRGGLSSVVATDVLQCVLLGAGMAGLSIFIARISPGGPIAGIAGQAGRPGYLDFFHDGQRTALIALSFFLAWTISPIAWQRVQAAGSVEKARRGLLAAAASFVFLYGLIVFIGMRSLSLFSGRSLSHPVISEIIISKAGIWGGGLLFVVVVAAILSTMDTAINTGALALTRDIYYEVRPRTGTGSPAAVKAGRLATLIVALLAFAVATRFQSILQTLGLASEIMAEGLFVPGMAMFISRKKRPFAGGLSLLLGGGFALLGFLSALNVWSLPLPQWPFSVPYGVALSVLGFAAGYLIDRFLRSRHKPTMPE